MIEDNNNNLIWLDLEMTGLGDEHVGHLGSQRLASVSQLILHLADQEGDDAHGVHGVGAGNLERVLGQRPQLLRQLVQVQPASLDA